jgi:hypothetical protein
MKFNIYPLYRPAPCVVRAQLLRKYATKNSLLGQNNNSKNNLKLDIRRLGKSNLHHNDQSSFVLKRTFASSPFFCVGENLDPSLDPYSTYGDSPIESEVEGSSHELADKYIGNPSGLISEQTNKMECLTEKSKIFISELLQDRSLERSNLQANELEQYDKDTRKLIQYEEELCKDELNRIAIIRDDALDLIDGASKSNGSDYSSDYESVTSESRIQGEYANLDSNTREIQNDHSRFIYNALQNLPSNYANSTLDAENDTSRAEPSFNAQTNFSVEAGASNFNRAIKDFEGIAESSKKRKHEDTEVESPAKKVKVDNYVVDCNNTPKNISSNNQSPLDYVLEKQQSDPYDFTDDID